jgi:hypothetical protein
MQKSLVSPETFFSDEPLFALDGLLNKEGLIQNSIQLTKEYEWLDALFLLRNTGTENESGEKIIPQFSFAHAPEASSAHGPFAHLVNKLDLSAAERILLLLTLEPYYRPLHMTVRLNEIYAKNKNLIFSYGYFKDSLGPGYYPTLQTLFFLCAGDDELMWREHEQEIIYHGKLFKEQIISLTDPDERKLFGNKLNHVLNIAPEYIDYMLHGRKPRPDFGRNFPAKWVTTNLSWDHLVLNNLTRNEITDVMDWVAHGKEVLSRSKNEINKSFPCLFYGPPGTGKSFTAKLIGKHYGKDVFRIDLSMIISKYIGETEKNLAQLFDRADGKDWILFFDEADALFGKRTGISDSKDKWANLEMSYLLQRMEEYEGLCILATNMKHNIDPAMSRRFQSVIFFPWPKPEERALIWKKSLPPGFSYREDISFEKLSRFDLSGAGIANIIKASCIKAVKRGDFIISSEDITRFIRIEYAKDNRTP